MNGEARMLEEWKASNDLLKFYEDLKQKRFAHFLTIQTAFLAFFTLLAKDAVGKAATVSLAVILLASIAPLLVALYFRRVDLRSRAFIDTINTRLLLIEKEWQALAPQAHFSTHGQLFSVLSRRDAEIVDRYVEARGLRGDGFRMLAGSRSAHASEHGVLQMFLWLWLLLAGFVAAHHLAQQFA
jgi:hypothetical protein